jgi:uncharacterized protein YcbK (DUF882 family)
LGDLTENLSRSEFACPCLNCEEKIPVADFELVNAIQGAVDHFSNGKDRKLIAIITSGNRCSAYNKKVGGSPRSQHLNNLAADLRIPGVTPEELSEYFDSVAPQKWGIGTYTRHVHIDVRPTRARWSI